MVSKSRPEASSGTRNTRFHGRVGDGTRPCAAPGCDEAGEFRAPPEHGGTSGYDGPAGWRWLCLDHVRAFNAGYNFFTGMTEEEIYEAQHPVSGWAQRRVGDPSPPPRWADFHDPLDAIGARFRDNLAERRQTAPNGQRLSEADRRALKTLELTPEADRRAIRQAYSTLVRRYHPDRNGGDRTHEKQLQEVIAAYTHLRKAAAFA